MIQHEPNEISINKITENIWVGNRACCMMHGKQVHGIEFDAEIDVDDETALDQPTINKIYLWLPTEDSTAPSPEQIKIGVSTLESLVKDNKKVYVHCRYGMGRSPFLVACYLVKTGLTPNEAINILTTKRPETSFSDIQAKAFEQYIISIN